LLLQDALHANPTGVLLVGSSNALHVRDAAEVAAMDPRTGPPEVDLMQLVTDGAG
jgi:hypothetical protein